MSSVGAFEAKTHFAQLLDRVARGERITITRHGIPAAELVPAAAAEKRRRRSTEELLEMVDDLHRRVKPDTMTIREMIEAGRRF